MNTPDRIKASREALKLTKRELARRIGVHESSINKYEKGVVDFPLSKISDLARVLKVTESYLMGWEDEEKDTPTSQGIKIPVLGTVPAGTPITAVEDILDYEEIPQSWGDQGEFFALQIKGDSMEPRMESGDVVIVRQQPDADSGDIVIALVNGDDATCKKLEKTDSGIMLVSTNPKYPPMYYSFEDIETLPVTILGKVVEFRGKF